MRRVLTLARHTNFFVATGIGALYLYFQETRGEKLKLMLELKMDDTPVLVPPEINNIIDEVKNEMKLKKEERHLIKPFMIQSLDLKHFGFANPKVKSFLGIPYYFLYKDKNDADFLTLVDKGIITKHTAEVQALINSMCLSTGAKKFGIARELYELFNSHVQIISALPVLIVTNCNIISYMIEKFSKRPAEPPYGVHVLIFFLGVAVYFLAFHLLIAYKETKSDFLASELGTSYIQGGIEYYDKMMKRNKIVRKLSVRAPYTEDGDVRRSILKPFQVPLSRRIIYLKDLGKSKKKKPSVWTYILYLY